MAAMHCTFPFEHFNLTRETFTFSPSPLIFMSGISSINTPSIGHIKLGLQFYRKYRASLMNLQQLFPRHRSGGTCIGGGLRFVAVRS